MHTISTLPSICSSIRGATRISQKRQRQLFPLKRHLMSAIAIMLTVSLNAPSVAADCKGQTEAQCAGSQSCRWVDTYQRKDGRTVKGFCRIKSKGNKRLGKAAAPKPKAK